MESEKLASPKCAHYPAGGAQGRIHYAQGQKRQQQPVYHGGCCIYCLLPQCNEPQLRYRGDGQFCSHREYQRLYTHREGIVLRSTYHVFDLYVNYLGDTVVDCWQDETPVLQVSHKNGAAVETSALDILATKWSDRAGMALAVVNKEPEKEHSFTLALPGNYTEAVLYSISGKTKDSYNDVGRTEVEIQKKKLGAFRNGMELTVKPHSVNILQLL